MITVADLAIFVCIYQVISLLTGVLALLSSVSILFENHSNNSENEWKCFVIGPLEKLSVTLRFSSGDDDCQQTGDRSIISSQVTLASPQVCVSSLKVEELDKVNERMLE